MEEAEVEVWAEALLIRISVTTGWSLPDQKVYSILTEQFRKKLVESYSRLNPEEIEYACRNYSPGVQDWGKKINLSLIDEVVRPYLQKRMELSKQEEYAILPPPPKKVESTSNFSMLRWLAQEIRYIRTGKPIELVPHELYDYLDKRGKITATKEEKWAYFQKAITYREIQLQKEWLDRSNTDNYNAVQGFIQMRKARRFTQSEYETLQRTAKKLLFFDLVQKQPDATRNPGHDQPCA